MARRYLTLDGLREVAAIIVVCFHMGYVRWMPTPAFGYLAVDIFFALSGFVLAQADDERFAADLRIHGRAASLMPTSFKANCCQQFKVNQMNSSCPGQQSVE
jgi:hypothetical protein